MHAFLIGEGRSRRLPSHYGDLILQAVAAKFTLPDNFDDQPWIEAESLLAEQGMRTGGAYPIVQSFDAEIRFTLHRDGTVSELRAAVPKPSPLDTALIATIAEADSAGFLPALLKDVRGNKVSLRLVLGTEDRAAIARRELFQAAIAVGQGAMPFMNNPRPAFPPEMLESGGHGTVVVEFVIGKDGQPEMSTFRAVWHTDMSLLREVKRVTPRLRFKPATVGGCPVRQRVQIPFEFNSW